MRIDTTVFKIVDMVIETARTLTLSLTFENEDGTPISLLTYVMRVEIYKGGKVIATLTEGNGFTISANELLFDYLVKFPAGCELTYAVIANEIYGPETTFLKGTWEIV